MSDDRNMKPVTVRFSPEAWNAIREIAAENKVSMAELVRMAVAGNLHRYLGDIRIIDEDEAYEIKNAIFDLFGTMSKIEMELHRIGVNYNQEVRLRNIEKKYSDQYGFSNSSNRYIEEMMIKNECRGFSKDDLDNLMKRYELATAKVGEVLCRIVT